MARRKSKTTTLQPAVTKMYFAVAAGDSLSYISLSHSASRLNRRFYRQGLNWAVANVKITQMPADATSTGSTSYVSSLPHTWSTANAWMKSYSVWKKQQDDALDKSDSRDMAARYRDFKISMEDTHTVGVDLSPVTLGRGRLIGPIATTGPYVGGGVSASEEWIASQIVIPNDGAPGVTNEYLLHMVGPNNGPSKGMIQGYAESRNLPVSPDPTSLPGGVDGSWMQEMFNVGDDSDDVTDNAQFRNNELPYDQDDYPGGSVNNVQLETQGFNWNRSTVGINTWSTGPFTAPCGLIRVDFQDQGTIEGSSNINIIEVTLVPGHARGYLTETMEAF